MAQKLILPLNKTIISASYKNTAYKAKFKFTHFGVDSYSSAGSTKIYASGQGTLIASGWDENSGNTVVIKYSDAYRHTTGTSMDIIFRYYHLDSIAQIPKGENAVNKDTLLGNYGGSGMGIMNKWAPHLHVEADSDIKYACYSPTFHGSGSIIKGTSAGANDSTCISYLEFMHCKTSAPDAQSYATANDVYINGSDKTIPFIA